MRGCSAPRGPWRRGAFYPERSSVPAISSARPRAQGARLLPPGAGSGSCESSRAAAAAPAAPVGRRPPSPSPLPPRSSWDPPACAPRQGQQGGCDAPVPGSPEPNLRVFTTSILGQHHDTKAAPHCHFRRSRGKKKQSLRKGGGVGANRAGTEARREHWEGPQQQGHLATFPTSPSDAPSSPSSPSPSSGGAFTCFLPG